MRGKEIVRHINISSLTVLNRNICTLNRRISNYVYTHFHKSTVSIPENASKRWERRFHDMVDDTNYRWDSKYIKSNLKNLNKNLEWLKSLNNLEQYLGECDTEGSLDNSRELLVKLEMLNHVDRIEEGEDKEIVEKYLNSKYPILSSIIPYISGTGEEFRRKHLLSNQFIQYTYTLISRNLEKLGTTVLIKYFNLLIELQLEDLNELMAEIYSAIYHGLVRGEVREEEVLDTRIKLLSKIIDVADLSRINKEVQEVMVDCISNNRVFYNNIDELLQVVYCYHTKTKNDQRWINWISESPRMTYRGSMNSENEEFINQYMEIYVEKLKSYIHMMSNSRVIKVLYFLYKVEYTEEEIFNKLVETIMYRFGDMTLEQNEMVSSLLASYKYLFVKKGSDLGETVYSEGCKMLQSMLREYLESKLVHVSLKRMFEPLTSLTMLNSKNKNLKELVMRKIDDNMVEQLDKSEFLKLLMLLNNLHINKTNEKISRIINRYVCKNILDGKKNESKLLEQDEEGIINLLSKFLPKKKYNRYLSEYVNRYLGAIEGELEESNANMGRIVNLLRVCMENRVYKFRGGEVVNNLLTKLISVMLQKENRINSNGNLDIISSDTLSFLDENKNNYLVGGSVQSDIRLREIEEFGLLREKFDRSQDIREYTGCLDITEDPETDMSNMITILESLNECSLSLKNVEYIAEEVYKRIFGLLKGRSRWNMKHVQEVLSLIIEIRLVPEELVKYMMEYINNYHLLSIPEIVDSKEYQEEEHEEHENEDQGFKLISQGDLHRNNFKVNLYLLYAKCVVFLEFKPSSEKMIENLYTYTIAHFNQFEIEEVISSKVGKKALENMRELMLFEKYRNKEFYENMKKKMNKELREFMEKGGEGAQELFQKRGGKLKAIIYSELGEEYEINCEIKGVTFDFYSEKKKEGVVILRKNHYYAKEGEDQVFLKHRAEMIKKISEQLNIGIKFIPEHTIMEEKQKRDYDDSKIILNGKQSDLGSPSNMLYYH